eukprot:UN34183
MISSDLLDCTMVFNNTESLNEKVFHGLPNNWGYFIIWKLFGARFNDVKQTKKKLGLEPNIKNPNIPIEGSFTLHKCCYSFSSAKFYDHLLQKYR